MRHLLASIIRFVLKSNDSITFVPPLRFVDLVIAFRFGRCGSTVCPVYVEEGANIESASLVRNLCALLVLYCYNGGSHERISTTGSKHPTIKLCKSYLQKPSMAS